MIPLFFTRQQLLVIDILAKGSKFNQLYFVDYNFPDLKMESVNFHDRIPKATFWVHLDNSMWHNGSKVASEVEMHHVSPLPH
jgi:hypothetical protein